eukprot:232691-Amphidinium_carterae.1
MRGHEIVDKHPRSQFSSESLHLIWRSVRSGIQHFLLQVHHVSFVPPVGLVKMPFDQACSDGVGHVQKSSGCLMEHDLLVLIKHVVGLKAAK